MPFSTGKRIVITGANSGIGFETARQLASDGAEIIMVCRSEERGQAALKRIKVELPQAQLALYTADLASPTSIRKFGEQLKKDYGSISMLINNAGGMFYDFMTTEDGLEYTFGLNHMGYFRVTKALLPLLQAGSSRGENSQGENSMAGAGAEDAAVSGRVINVASHAHRFAELDFSGMKKTDRDKDQQKMEMNEQKIDKDEQKMDKDEQKSGRVMGDKSNKRKYKAFQEYGKSKLANILFTRELAKRMAGKGVEAVSLHPGFVNTNFGSLDDRRLSTMAFKGLAKVFGISADKGASTSVYLARSERIENGAYYAGSAVKRPSQAALDDAAAKQLWELSEELA